MPIVATNIALLSPLRVAARRFHSLISAAIATIESPPGFTPVFPLPLRQHWLFQPWVREATGTISARRGGVNWKMGKSGAGIFSRR
ncbi:MAG: hypothetical protein E7813_07850 [Bradyrhizobium sp.]|uniref:hypothetical protein n=1 Tax=Bradyrhizobium sp. TaxID=376 RepID=UPI001209C985|nr:hypothetical protein [Bradyrhizobium sp.]THD70630.1 MAG: hypothetical protein E7813_07850 [Bradyrhizobium sp.]